MDRLPSCAPARDDRGGACCSEVVPQRIGVVTAIGDQPAQASRDRRDHLRSNSYIAGVARGEVDDRRPANDVGDDVDLGGLPPRETPMACAFAPLMDGPPLTSQIRLAYRSGDRDGGRAMAIAVLGVDLGKNSCSVVGLDPAGKVVLRRRMRRETVIGFASSLPSCIVGMEACCGAHHMGRALAAQGHTIRLMSPEYVRPYVKAHKNDDRDAEAIAEAATRPTMRFVALKSEAQLDVQTLHRVRDQLVGERTSLMNQIRSVLLERGHVIPQVGRSSPWASENCSTIQRRP